MFGWREKLQPHRTPHFLFHNTLRLLFPSVLCIILSFWFSQWSHWEWAAFMIRGRGMLIRTLRLGVHTCWVANANTTAFAIFRCLFFSCCNNNTDRFHAHLKIIICHRLGSMQSENEIILLDFWNHCYQQ